MNVDTSHLTGRTSSTATLPNLERSGARTQLAMMSAQLAAGIGNMAVSLIAARILTPGGYAHVVTFLSLYVLANVPGAALSASAALDPGASRRGTRRALQVSVAMAVVLAGLSAPLGSRLGLDTSTVVALAAVLPGAVLLGLRRGEAYARRDHATVARSLGVEPLMRLTLGIALMVVFGPAGAIWGAVLGGYAALAVCLRADGGRPAPMPQARTARATCWTESSGRMAAGLGLAFAGLVVVQTVALVVANARLDDLGAGQFGAIATIGGGVVFATATIPLVLLPSAGDHGGADHAVAMRIAALTGLVLAALGWLAAAPIMRLAVGTELAGGARWLGPYLVAMGAIGVIRVQIAIRWSQGDRRFVAWTLVAALTGELIALLAVGRSLEAIVMSTLVATGSTMAVLTLAPDRERAAWSRSPWFELVQPRRLAFMTGLGVAAVLVRISTGRGLWVDEAISVRQAQLPFRAMIQEVGFSDVHPPLHHAVLWVTVRVLGTSETAVRIPSLLAGLALVPALWWVGRVLYDRRTGWIAATIAAIAPFAVWYSQEARMYSIFMLLAAIALGAQVEALRTGRRVQWLLYGLATAALAWTQYFAILPILVQQAAFAAVWLRRRRTDPASARRLLRGWIGSTAMVLVLVLPLIGFAHGQYVGYGNRESGLIPGQAGTTSSAVGAGISIYSVAANVIWAIWGYHSDDTMVLIAALWPLAMLLVLVMLGRGRSARTALVAALAIAPLIALFAVGAWKRDLFELRYFSGTVPALIVLGARLVTVTIRNARGQVLATGLIVLTLGTALVDQQLNGANPRLYDFDGAMSVVQERDGSDTAVLLYAPEYLESVIGYYAADLDIRPIGSAVPADASTVWVLASERVVQQEATAAEVGRVLAELERERTIVDTIERANVRVWELR